MTAEQASVCSVPSYCDRQKSWECVAAFWRESSSQASTTLQMMPTRDEVMQSDCFLPNEDREAPSVNR
jgi:hypothetical protein